MHVDLVESLRCPNPHEDGWLVAAADRVVARRILEGLVGCPACGAEWRILDGELDFRTSGGAEVIRTSVRPASVPVADQQPHDGPRLAALLHIVDSAGVVALLGNAAVGADALGALTGVQVLAINPPPDVARSHSRIRVHDLLPLGVGTLIGVQCDTEHATPQWLLSAGRAVRRGGRVVAPASTPVPDALHELARDAHEWVAEVRVDSTGLVPLRRAGDPMRRG